MHPSKTSSMAA
jgi:hypothetical protein